MRNYGGTDQSCLPGAVNQPLRVSEKAECDERRKGWELSWDPTRIGSKQEPIVVASDKLVAARSGTTVAATVEPA